MTRKAIILATLLLSGCAATTNPSKETSSRWSNAGAGAAIGCLATGPFCILGIGPLIGAVIGGNVDVEEKPVLLSE